MIADDPRLSEVIGNNAIFPGVFYRMMFAGRIKRSGEVAQVMDSQSTKGQLWLIEDILCAGLSSLALIFIRLHSDFSFLYLLAMVPYYFRLLRVSVLRAVLLGTILATSYLFVTAANSIFLSPGSALLQLAFLNLIFISFGVAINRARAVFGFNPLLLFLLWLPLDFGLNQLPAWEQFLQNVAVNPGVTTRFSVLFDFLIIATVLVLLNPLMLLVASHVVERALSRAPAIKTKERRNYSLLKEFKLSRQWYYFPDFRAPPIAVTL